MKTVIYKCNDCGGIVEDPEILYGVTVCHYTTPKHFEYLGTKIDLCPPCSEQFKLAINPKDKVANLSLYRKIINVLASRKML